ncbi:MAG: NAD-dependent epimerase/dehydratase family protein [Myxococcales bacterium]|nr:NAD-dependent epimerase/dehydratase family protein [Myxococcales bacterium]
MSDAPKPYPTVVAVTGACTDLGVETLRQLSDDPRIERLIALDVAKPDVISDKVQFVRLDLSQPGAGMRIADVLDEYSPDTFVHGAFLSTPTHDGGWAHELEDVGTMHVLDACARNPPQRLVLLSTTLVYGAKPDQPTYLREDARLGEVTKSRFVNDRIRAEEQVLRFARSHPSIDVCSLRFAKVLGPNSDNIFTRFLSRPVAPTLAGYDPLMQCVHEDDAIRAILLAIRKSARGVFNIVGKDILPYTTLLALLGRLPLPLPLPIARAVGKAMWATKLSEVPSTMVEHLQYSCVADEGKARVELGFEAKYDIRQTLAEFLGMPIDRPAPAGRPTAQSATWMN